MTYDGLYSDTAKLIDHRFTLSKSAMCLYKEVVNVHVCIDQRHTSQHHPLNSGISGV